MTFWPRPPPARSSARAQGQQVMNSAILEDSFVIVHGSMTGSHRWQKTAKNGRLVRRDSLRSQGQDFDPPQLENFTGGVEHS